jgi:hypothetical protein
MIAFLAFLDSIVSSLPVKRVKPASQSIWMPGLREKIKIEWKTAVLSYFTRATTFQSGTTWR